MNLFVDDERDPDQAGQLMHIYGRAWHDDIDWTVVRTSQEAVDVLSVSRIEKLALDNDLGMGSETDGDDIAGYILARTVDEPDYEPPSEMYCISFNPIARARIEATFEDIRRVERMRDGHAS